VIAYDMKNRQGLDELVKLQHEFEKAGSQSQRKLAHLRTAVLETTPDIWQGTGILKVSHVFRGPRLPRRYRLFDPIQQRTTAYIELAKDSEVVIEKYLGRHVAVSGQVYYDPKLRTNIIKANQFLVKPMPTTAGSENK